MSAVTSAAAPAAATDADKVRALFEAARAQAEEDHWDRYAGRPPITEAGLLAADAVLLARPGLSAFAARLFARAREIPAASRRRRVLGALAYWLPRASHAARNQERWFYRALVHEIAEATGGAASEAEAAGLLALAVLGGRDGPN
jgi:hypothetical protein